jgi:3-hydroxymyristoyl/3-hydroxydecanoyl-(acyl carrier protein) dehydratase
MPPLALLGRLPHRPPMLWLDSLVKADDAEGTAVGVVGADNPFLLPDGRLDPLAAVELVAQAAAALAANRDGAAIRGFLVGVRAFDFENFAAYPGAAVQVRVRRGKSFEQLASHHGVVEIDGRPFAAGEIKVFATDVAVAGSAGVPTGNSAVAGSAGVPTGNSAVAGNAGVPTGNSAVAGSAGVPTGNSGDLAPERALFPGRLGTGAPPAGSSIHPLPGRWGRVTADGATYELDASFPAFRGHFPGEPILPAVALCALALHAARAASPSAILRRIPFAKFTRPVAPGERLTIACDRSAPIVHCSLFVDRSPAASVSFELGD